MQLDGSFHDWYEARGPRGCLMTLVDDATGRTLARLGDEETIWSLVMPFQISVQNDDPHQKVRIVRPDDLPGYARH